MCCFGLTDDTFLNCNFPIVYRSNGKKIINYVVAMVSKKLAKINNCAVEHTYTYAYALPYPIVYIHFKNTNAYLY